MHTIYDALFKKCRCKSILELGCGNGDLTRYFLQADYDYTGLDISAEMLEIAGKINPTAHFITGDMRDFQSTEKFDWVIILCRSFCYMIMNADLMNFLISIHNTLKEDGILMLFLDFKRTTL